MSDITGFDLSIDPIRYRYEVLADHLAELINTGVLTPNTRLPPESQLGSMYGVSLGTARRAVWLLRERGLVVTVRSKGTYVTANVTPVANVQDDIPWIVA